MHARCNADNRAFAHGAQKVALELDGGETLRSFGQVGEGPVTAGGIRDGDDDGGMQVAVGGQQFRTQGQAAGESSRLDAGKFDADQARQGPLAERVQLVKGRHGWKV